MMARIDDSDGAGLKTVSISGMKNASPSPGPGVAFAAGAAATAKITRTDAENQVIPPTLSFLLATAPPRSLVAALERTAAEDTLRYFGKLGAPGSAHPMRSPG